MERLLRSLLVLSLLCILPDPALRVSGSSLCPRAGQADFSLSLDGLDLRGCLPGSPIQQPWVVPDPSLPVQTAYTAGGFAITAIPFGTAASSEIFPLINGSSDEDSLRAQLRQFRQSQGARTSSGPAAVLFDRPVESLVSVLLLPGSGNRPQRLSEWLAIAGQRLWIVRALQEVGDLGLPALDLQLNSPDLSLLSTSAAARLTQTRRLQAVSGPSSVADETNLRTPPWWSGACDNGHYQWDSYMNPYRYPSYSLGTVYRNVTACGPRPAYYEGPDVLIYFFPGAFGAYEWECVELSFRFMYLAYGVAPYPANGNGVVPNYSGSVLDKVVNGTSGKAPAPGDILSYCSYCTYGHTSVVTSASINSSGNGSIMVMEQNYSYNGRSTLTVSNWTVVGNNGPVSSWLHPHPTPTPTATRTSTPSVTPNLTPLPAPTFDPSLPNHTFIPLIGR